MSIFSIRTRSFASRIVLSTLLAGACATGCIQESGEPACIGDSCDQDDDIVVPQGMSAIRVVHASPDAPAVDVWVEGLDTPVLSGLSYGDASGYLMVEAGRYNVQLRAAPSTLADPIVYATGEIELMEQARTAAVASGLLGSQEAADRFRVLTLREDFGPAGTGSAIVRVLHAGSDAPSVALDLHDDNAAAPELTGLDRFTATDSAGFAIPAGEPVQIGIVAGGARLTAFTTPALPEGAQLLVVATGLAGKLAREADGFSLLAVGPDGSLGFIRQNPVVYALHASPNAPQVDVFAGDREIIDNISFGELSGGLQLPPDSYELDFFVHSEGSERPAGQPAASATTGMIERGERYLSIATGLLGQQDRGFQLASYAEGFDTTGSDARVRLIHSGPDAPTVDVGVLNAELIVNPVLVGGVSFLDASAPQGLNAGTGTIPLGVTPAQDNDNVLFSFHVPTEAGARAFAIAAGAVDPSNGESFRLLVVDTAPTPWSVTTVHPQP